MLEKDIERVLVDETEINAIAKQIGEEITRDYQGKKPLIIGLLKGCMPFMGLLIRHIDLYCDLDLMGVTSYHGGISSSGDVKITKDLDTPVVGRDIIIAEDIVDTAKTIDIVRKLLLYRGAKSVEVATMLNKPAGRVLEFEPKYIGKTIPKEFVVGFGLDYDEMYRNLPYVGVLKSSVYKK
ncbi:MAG TPA: hypoxanthine phosphoribosyltransferase [Bacillota bacterium]|nr:hypoxanthine phosphoribosyltransferase [Bacillota bacterium]HPF42315.1 hypoxanthine phosphoribosyltransferase [Bacillota bacterium]HPJ86183.1 hypoxanthine phosphoribosyltransferase [Bacillota bacterium]HPQ61880.1 hypoxanthine phosphoribosyltransferase [Bacillota bacterium]HRX91373.1 hypoxanthine phosphoribosyltransferase [Candidatus Izemoplasmatales bacterium]